MDTVRLEIKTEVLNQLLRNGYLCAADLKSLDKDSKRCLWDLCLKNCMNCKLNIDNKTKPYFNESSDIFTHSPNKIRIEVINKN